jgi:hypothetical protein
MEISMGKKISAGIVVVLLLAGAVYFGLDRAAESSAAERIQQFVDASPLVKEVRYQTLDVGLVGSQARMENVTVKMAQSEDVLNIQSISISDIAVQDDLPTRLNLTATGIAVPEDAKAMRELAPVLNDLGYGQIATNLRFQYDYDPAARRLTVDKFMVEAADAGQFTAHIQLENIDLKSIPQQPENALSMMPLLTGITLKAASMTYTDHSLLDRIIVRQAQQEGITPDAFKNLLSQQLEMHTGQLQDPSTLAIVKSLQNFIRNPKKITVSIAPAAAVSIFQFIAVKDFADVVRILNLKVTS